MCYNMKRIKTMTNSKHVGFRAPLNKEDTPEKTLGCRAANPDICKLNGTSFCAFCRTDGMCAQPPKTWPKQYEKLKAEESEKKNG